MEDKYYIPNVEELLYALSTKELIYQRGVDGKLITIKYYDENPIEDTIHTFLELNDCIVKNNGDAGFSRTYSIPCNQYLLKYLDKEDIESLGFKLFNGEDVFEKHIKEYRGNSNLKCHIIFRKSILIMIGDDETPWSNWNVLFTGIINNKSELKKLLIQLQLINE